MCQLFQRWQLIEVCQPKVLQELKGSAIDNGPASLLQPSNWRNQAMPKQGAQDTIAVHAARGFDLRTGNGLAVGHQSQGLQSGRRQPRAGIQAQEMLHIRGRLRRRHKLNLVVDALHAQPSLLIAGYQRLQRTFYC